MNWLHRFYRRLFTIKLEGKLCVAIDIWDPTWLECHAIVIVYNLWSKHGEEMGSKVN